MFLLISYLVSIHLVVNVISHSFLLNPKGDFVSFNKAECRVGGPDHEPNDNCTGPCIRVDSWQFDKNAPYSVYKRGQEVTIFWSRNNHFGGFVRFAIVPEHLRMSHEAHNRLAFHFSCFDSGSHECMFKQCGTDDGRIVFCAKLKIPTIYPDNFSGVLAWSWFGGLVSEFKEIKSFFGDYWSCRSIRIKGGESESEIYPVVFQPDAGKGTSNPKSIGKNSCLSSVNNVSICVKEPCRHKTPKFMRPAPFMSGRVPSSISAYWISPSPSTSPLPTSSSKPMTLTASVQLGPTPSSTTAYTHWKDMKGGKARVLVKRLQLIDIDTEKVIEDRFYRTTVIPSSTTRMTFEAKTTGQTSYVNFFLDDVFLRNEFQPPYTAFGDEEGKSAVWPNPIFNTWFKMNVTAWSPSRFLHYKVYWIRLVKPSGTVRTGNI